MAMMTREYEAAKVSTSCNIYIPLCGIQHNTTHNPHTHTEYRKREKVREGERAKEREKQLESQM